MFVRSTWRWALCRHINWANSRAIPEISKYLPPNIQAILSEEHGGLRQYLNSLPSPVLVQKGGVWQVRGDTLQFTTNEEGPWPPAEVGKCSVGMWDTLCRLPATLAPFSAVSEYLGDETVPVVTRAISHLNVYHQHFEENAAEKLVEYLHSVGASSKEMKGFYVGLNPKYETFSMTRQYDAVRVCDYDIYRLARLLREKPTLRELRGTSQGLLAKPLNIVLASRPDLFRTTDGRVEYILPKQFAPPEENVAKLEEQIELLKQEMKSPERSRGRFNLIRRSDNLKRKLFHAMDPTNVYLDPMVLAFAIYDALEAPMIIGDLMNLLPESARRGYTVGTAFFNLLPHMFVTFRVPGQRTSIHRAGLPMDDKFNVTQATNEQLVDLFVSSAVSQKSRDGSVSLAMILRLAPLGMAAEILRRFATMENFFNAFGIDVIGDGDHRRVRINAKWMKHRTEAHNDTAPAEESALEEEK